MTQKLAVPDFNLPALDGSNISLSSLLGKPIVIDFWASWCGPCRRAIPKLVELHAAYESKVSFLGIAINDKREDTEKAIKDDNIFYPVLIGNNDVARAYGIEGIPTMYILDAKGNVAFKETGFDADSGLVRMERVLKKLVPK